jgi:hypothetical protein
MLACLFTCQSYTCFSVDINMYYMAWQTSPIVWWSLSRHYICLQIHGTSAHGHWECPYDMVKASEDLIMSFRICYLSLHGHVTCIIGHVKIPYDMVSLYNSMVKSSWTCWKYPMVNGKIIHGHGKFLQLHISCPGYTFT